jgi:hypothetical protein
MVKEREVLEKMAFPELRHWCESIRVAPPLSINVGWGVTSYRGDPNQALSTCLALVSRCDYFIGLLGERYGTEHETADELLLREYPWLAERQGRSFVELECACGVLSNKPVAKRAFFYLRIGGTIPAGKPSLKLAALKQETERSGCPVRHYADPAVLARGVFEDLQTAIAEDYAVS